MAQQCPCGCGKAIGLWHKGPAAGWRSVASPLGELQGMKQVWTARVGADNDIVRAIEVLEREGVALLRVLETHLHSPRPLHVQPDLMLISRARTEWFNRLRRLDAAFEPFVREAQRRQ